MVDEKLQLILFDEEERAQIKLVKTLQVKQCENCVDVLQINTQKGIQVLDILAASIWMQ